MAASTPVRHEEPSDYTSLSDNPIGLTAIWAPPEPIIDIIFVHGLGGNSVQTWCFDENLATFWPSWLKNEPELRRARIHTYGYVAGIGKAANASGILDFAKDLLFKMRMEYADRGPSPAIGTVRKAFEALHRSVRLSLDTHDAVAPYCLRHALYGRSSS